MALCLVPPSLCLPLCLTFFAPRSASVRCFLWQLFAWGSFPLYCLLVVVPAFSGMTCPLLGVYTFIGVPLWDVAIPSCAFCFLLVWLSCLCLGLWSGFPFSLLFPSLGLRYSVLSFWGFSLCLRMMVASVFPCGVLCGFLLLALFSSGSGHWLWSQHFLDLRALPPFLHTCVFACSCFSGLWLTTTPLGHAASLPFKGFGGVGSGYYSDGGPIGFQFLFFPAFSLSELCFRFFGTYFAAFDLVLPCFIRLALSLVRMWHDVVRCLACGSLQ